jgi:hypothetical protein
MLSSVNAKLDLAKVNKLIAADIIMNACGTNPQAEHLAYFLIKQTRSVSKNTDKKQRGAKVNDSFILLCTCLYFVKVNKLTAADIIMNACGT